MKGLWQKEGLRWEQTLQVSFASFCRKRDRDTNKAGQPAHRHRYRYTDTDTDRPTLTVKSFCCSFCRFKEHKNPNIKYIYISALGEIETGKKKETFHKSGKRKSQLYALFTLPTRDSKDVDPVRVLNLPQSPPRFLIQ